MAKYKPRETDGVFDDEIEKRLSPREHLVGLLEHFGGVPPPPMPRSYDGAADWWIAQMQRPRRDTERVSRTAMGELDPYIGRLKATLSAFINLPDDKQRSAIHAGVREGVEWRGESLGEYMAIYDETMRMRGMNAHEYITHARKMAHNYIRKQVA